MTPYNYKAIEKKWKESVETLSVKKAVSGSVLEKYQEIQQMHEKRMKHPVKFSQDYYWDYGSDAVRMYEMFVEPDKDEVNWDDGGLDGIYRFLTRFWRMAETYAEDTEDVSALCSEMICEIEKRFVRKSPATAIAVLMEYTRKMCKRKADNVSLQKVICLLAPFAPYLALELWNKREYTGSVMDALWPVVQAEERTQIYVEIPVQVNGKVKGKIAVTASEPKEVVLERAEKILCKYGKDQNRKKVIYVPGRIISVQI